MLTDEERNKIIADYMYGHLSDMCKEIERAVLAKAMQNDADAAFEAYINERGGEDSYAWHDAPVDGIFKDGFAAGRLAKAMPIPKQDPVGYMVRGNFFYSKSEAERSADHITANHENCEVDAVYIGSVPSQAAAIPEGYTAIKTDVFLWLLGENGDFECPKSQYFRDKPAPYFWRKNLRASALSASPKPE